MIEGLESADALLKASLIIGCPVRRPTSACDGEREKDQRREDPLFPCRALLATMAAIRMTPGTM